MRFLCLTLLTTWLGLYAQAPAQDLKPPPADGSFPRASNQQPPILLWTGNPPGDEGTSLPMEANLTKPTDNKPAGKEVIRIGNVRIPLLEVFRPKEGKANGAAVIICPGGGQRILAWDLEGTEVAQWLADQGYTAFVLKYRVPTRMPESDKRYYHAVMDAQRAIRLVRSKASDWKFHPDKIGICGFSAGGETAARAMLMERIYPKVDSIDEISGKVAFAMLIYPSSLADTKTGQLKPDLPVTKDSPPTFFVHAGDDPVTADSSLLLCMALRKQKIPCEAHIFASGGHGYGMRKTDSPVTHWGDLAEGWLKRLPIWSEGPKK